MKSDLLPVRHRLFPAMSAKDLNIMDTSQHTLSTLFDQLGLPSDEKSVNTFLARHAPLPGDVPLPDAGFWSPAQAQFLKEGVAEDAEWAEAIDELDVLLRR